MPLRVALVSHSADLDGAEQCLLDLALWMLQQEGKFAPLVIVPGSGRLPDRLRNLGVDVIRLDYRSALLSEAGSFRALFAKLFSQRKPDVVYSNSSVMVDSALAAGELGISHVWHVHEDLKSFVECMGLTNASGMMNAIASTEGVVISPTSTITAGLRSLGVKLVVTVPNGVSSMPVIPKPEARDMLGINQDVLAILQVGVLEPRKNHELAIQTLQRLSLDTCRVCLCIAGDGDPEYEAAMRCLAGRLGVNGQIVWLGWMPDVTVAFSAADVLLHPSKSEACPRSILEAFSALVPVVTTAWRGVMDVVEHGKTGLISRYEAEELANWIRQLHTIPELRAGVTRAAKQQYDSMHTREHFCEAIARVLVGAYHAH